MQELDDLNQPNKMIPIDTGYLLRWLTKLTLASEAQEKRIAALEAQLPAVHGMRKVLQEEREARKALEEISSLEVKS